MEPERASIRAFVAALLAACAAFTPDAARAAGNAAQVAGDAARGQELYTARCGACHSIDDHGAGPRHRGLFQRRAGSEPGYDFSPALRQSGIVWSAQKVDQWLANPNALVPGNKMVVQLANDARDRADIVAYLLKATR
jgi:cytochrome c